MSILVQDILENNTTITQDIRIDKSFNGAHIRPHIYVEGVLADGDLQMEVLQGAVVLATQTLGFVAINAAMSDTFNHGMIRFDFASLQLNLDEGNITQDYIIRLGMINHTDSSSIFIAWNKFSLLGFPYTRGICDF